MYFKKYPDTAYSRERRIIQKFDIGLSIITFDSGITKFAINIFDRLSDLQDAANGRSNEG